MKCFPKGADLEVSIPQKKKVGLIDRFVGHVAQNGDVLLLTSLQCKIAEVRCI